MSSDKEPQSGITNVQLGDSKGLLSGVGDPLGKGLEKGLSPVGNAVGGLTQGVSGKSTDIVHGAGQALGMKESESKPNHPPESPEIGGKEQTAENPLGL